MFKGYTRQVSCEESVDSMLSYGSVCKTAR